MFKLGAIQSPSSVAPLSACSFITSLSALFHSVQTLNLSSLVGPTYLRSLPFCCSMCLPTSKLGPLLPVKELLPQPVTEAATIRLRTLGERFVARPDVGFGAEECTGDYKAGGGTYTTLKGLARLAKGNQASGSMHCMHWVETYRTHFRYVHNMVQNGVLGGWADTKLFSSSFCHGHEFGSFRSSCCRRSRLVRLHVFA